MTAVILIMLVYLLNNKADNLRRGMGALRLTLPLPLPLPLSLALGHSKLVLMTARPRSLYIAYLPTLPLSALLLFLYEMIVSMALHSPRVCLLISICCCPLASSIAVAVPLCSPLLVVFVSGRSLH